MSATMNERMADVERLISDLYDAVGEVEYRLGRKEALAASVETLACATQLHVAVKRLIDDCGLVSLHVPVEVEVTCESSYLDEVVAFARTRPKEEQETLRRSLDWIARIAANNPKEPCKLYRDFAPYSFGWCAGGLVGGLIFHGAHDGGGDGGAPTYSVNLRGMNGWALHT